VRAVRGLWITVGVGGVEIGGGTATPLIGRFGLVGGIPRIEARTVIGLCVGVGVEGFPLNDNGGTAPTH